MNLIHRLRRRHRRIRLAALALLALLLQQVALIGYACPVMEAPAPATIEMSHCEGMPMHDADSPSLCQQHCVRDHVATPDLKAPQVPAQILPPLQFALSATLSPPLHSRHYRDVPLWLADPPPAQRFCSLQI